MFQFCLLIPEILYQKQHRFWKQYFEQTQPYFSMASSSFITKTSSDRQQLWQLHIQVAPLSQLIEHMKCMLVGIAIKGAAAVTRRCGLLLLCWQEEGDVLILLPAEFGHGATWIWECLVGKLLFTNRSTWSKAREKAKIRNLLLFYG